MITSEEQMLPILEQSDHQLNSKIQSVGWLEAGLLTKDIFEQLPYEEHPYNIAPVLKLAEEIGLDKGFVLRRWRMLL